MGACIYTFGYEGLDISAFLARLSELRIETIIDVRANPLSRKRGFSRNALSEALRGKGVTYLHLKAMGCPKPVRDRYKQDGDWQSYTRSFLTYLGQRDEDIERVCAIAQKSRSCLLCFEADFNRCHRTFVGRAVARSSGLELIHITDQTTIPERAVRVAA
jgi:uncharacterized protein (DUF488 family)